MISDSTSAPDRHPVIGVDPPRGPRRSACTRSVRPSSARRSMAERSTPRYRGGIASGWSRTYSAPPPAGIKLGLTVPAGSRVSLDLLTRAPGVPPLETLHSSAATATPRRRDGPNRRCHSGASHRNLLTETQVEFHPYRIHPLSNRVLMSLVAEIRPTLRRLARRPASRRFPSSRSGSASPAHRRVQRHQRGPAPSTALPRARAPRPALAYRTRTRHGPGRAVGRLLHPVPRQGDPLVRVRRELSDGSAATSPAARSRSVWAGCTSPPRSCRRSAFVQRSAATSATKRIDRAAPASPFSRTRSGVAGTAAIPRSSARPSRSTAPRAKSSASCRPTSTSPTRPPRLWTPMAIDRANLNTGNFNRNAIGRLRPASPLARPKRRCSRSSCACRTTCPA